MWAVGPEGGVTVLADAKGLHYLRLLLARPGQHVPATDLSATVAGHPGTTVLDGDLGATSDRRALAAYRRRLDEIDRDLSEADAWADGGRAAELRAEREALLHEIGGAVGLFGRTRVAGTSAERARIAVRKAIAAAISHVDRTQPEVARVLQNTISTGTRCRYEPDPGRRIRWVLDGG
jgi:hypothetical protein